MWNATKHGGQVSNTVKVRFHQEDTMRRFNPARGGHAPGELRDAFVEWVDDGCHLDSAIEVYWTQRPVRWLLGQLWNCTDTLPSHECEGIGVRRGSSYAQAVRRLWLEARQAARA